MFHPTIGCGERPKQSVLLQFQFEASILHFYRKPASRKGVLER